MSIMIDLPPAMAQEELNRRHEVDAVMSKLDALAKKTSARLTGVDLPRECMVYSC